MAQGRWQRSQAGTIFKDMRIETDDYPQLRLLCWNRDGSKTISGEDALALYEANWRHIDQDALTPEERKLLQTLAAEYGNGVLNV